MDLDLVYEAGKRAGGRPRASSGECPFTQEHLDCRIAWLDGFFDGRWASSADRGASPARSSFYGSGIAAGLNPPHRT